MAALKVRIPKLRHLRRAVKSLVDSRLRRLKVWSDAQSVDLDATGTGQTFTASPIAVAATGVLTFTGTPLDTKTVVIDGKTYTFQTTLTDVDGNVVIGADADKSLDNLIAAMELGTRQTAATGILTLTGQPLNTETVVVDAKTYTFQTTLTDVDGNVVIGADADKSLDNLIAAMELGTRQTTATGVLTLTGIILDTETVVIDGKTYTFQTTLTDVDGNVVIGVNPTDNIDNLIAAMNLGTRQTAATNTLTLTGQPLDTETVVIGSTTYTFQTSLVDSADNVLIGATASDSLDNLIVAVSAGAGAGTLYGTGTVANTSATIVAGAGDTADLTAITAGLAGNAVATTETLTNGFFSGIFLTGGIDHYAASMTAHPTVGSAAGAGDTMDLTADTAGLGGNSLATTETLPNGSFANATLTGGIDHYALAMTAHPSVGAAAGVGDTMDLTADTAGLGGNSIASTETLTNGSFANATLLGGIDHYAVSMTGHPSVGAAVGAGDTMDLTADVAGLAGNAIGTIETMDNGSFANATLLGGLDAEGLTISSHGQVDGAGPFEVSNSGGALPAGLVAGTLYWLNLVDANSLSLHLSKEDALNSVNAVDITGAGTGTHTLTPSTADQAMIELARQGISTERITLADDIDDLI